MLICERRVVIMKDHCDNVYKGLEDSRGLVNVGFFPSLINEHLQ